MGVCKMACTEEVRQEYGRKCKRKKMSTVRVQLALAQVPQSRANADTNIPWFSCSHPHRCYVLCARDLSHIRISTRIASFLANWLDGEEGPGR
jgi:hypothetical protein